MMKDTLSSKSTTKTKKSRRELPEDLTDFYIADGEVPSDLDVIAGRGHCANNHPGNKRYWHLILAERAAYRKLGKRENGEKNKIARAIYNYVLSTGGRFLQLDSKTEKWFNLPQKIGLEKIKQALRDKYVPNFLDQEPQSTMITSHLLRKSAPSEAEKEQFRVFLEKASPPTRTPKTDCISFNTSSIDLSSILGQASLERMQMLMSDESLKTISKPFDQIKDDASFECTHRGHLFNSPPLRDCRSSRKRKRETNDDLDAYVVSNQFVSKRIRKLAGAIERHGKTMGDLQLELLMNKMNCEILAELKKDSIILPSLSQ